MVLFSKNFDFNLRRGCEEKAVIKKKKKIYEHHDYESVDKKSLS